MKNMNLQNICKACGGRLFNSEGQFAREITGAVIDSRLAEAGGLFVATTGEKVDGHRFIGQVYEKGVLCVVTEKTPEQVEKEHGIPKESWGAYILTENSLKALKEIAEYYRKQLSIPIVGITGSVGKTSTKEFIAGVLSEKYKVLKTEGNFNNEIGLPLTLLKIREEHEAAVVEMGISEFGEMHRLSKMARPDVCVLTNIGQCHLENLKSREGILKAKSEIFDYMSEDGYVCVNGDDDMLASLDVVKGRKVIRFGLTRDGIFDRQLHGDTEASPRNDVYASEIESNGLWGCTAVMNMGGEAYPVTVKLPGRHMVANAMAAAAVAGLLGLTVSSVRQGIEKIQPVGGRSNIIRLAGMTVIDDCYNANPVSMRSAIDLLDTADGRKAAILGDMFELGVNSDAMHKEIGQYAAHKGIDLILCVGKQARILYDGAMEGYEQGQDICHFSDKEEMRKKLPDLLKEGDTVLVKASHGMGFQEIVEWLRADDNTGSMPGRETE